EAISLSRLPLMPLDRSQFGIGVIGAGFIVRDCHLVAYREAGFRVVDITSRTLSKAEAVAAKHDIAKVSHSIEELLDNPAVNILDIAVPPVEQPEVIRRVLRHNSQNSRLLGILAQKPLAMVPSEALKIVRGCADKGIVLQVNQNMRYDPAVRVAKHLLNDKILGDVVLATIQMRAVPHWMDWARDGRSLATYIMSIHHLDCFRYWLGDPTRVIASTRRDPRTQFPHEDGLNLYVLEYENGARAAAWDDVWAGPVHEGAASEISIQWRIEGTEGLAMGEIGWPGWPERVPSTLKFSTIHDGGKWHAPHWSTAWFPDAFAGTMAGLMIALEANAEPDINGTDNLKSIALCESVMKSAKEHRAISPKEVFAEMQLTVNGSGMK
ncbi:MAG: Gfo/Idh/MocA family protein, partial [bacterium]